MFKRRCGPCRTFFMFVLSSHWDYNSIAFFMLRIKEQKSAEKTLSFIWYAITLDTLTLSNPIAKLLPLKMHSFGDNGLQILGIDIRTYNAPWVGITFAFVPLRRVKWWDLSWKWLNRLVIAKKLSKSKKCLQTHQNAMNRKIFTISIVAFCFYQSCLFFHCKQINHIGCSLLLLLKRSWRVACTKST